jgi:hypothetical protein
MLKFINLDYYGPEYSEIILTEWNTRKLVFHIHSYLLELHSLFYHIFYHIRNDEMEWMLP